MELHHSFASAGVLILSSGRSVKVEKARYFGEKIYLSVAAIVFERLLDPLFTRIRDIARRSTVTFTECLIDVKYLKAEATQRYVLRNILVYVLPTYIKLFQKIVRGR